MIAVPEIVGHTLFDRPHPASSSVNAAVSLTDKISKDPKYNLNCNLALENDPSGSDIARAAGLEGKYGTYSCV
jgi:hypothetical protein